MRIETLRRTAVAVALAALAAVPARAADNVTVGTVGSASANLWPVYIGINKGFFAAENLNVELIFVQSSANLVHQLTAGSLNITMSTGLVDPIRAIDQGAPIAIVRFEVQAPPYALSAKASIKSLAELKGKNLVLWVGFANTVSRAIPQGLTVTTDGSKVQISGPDKQLVGQFASDPAAARQLVVLKLSAAAGAGARLRAAPTARLAPRSFTLRPIEKVLLLFITSCLRELSFLLQF